MKKIFTVSLIFFIAAILFLSASCNNKNAENNGSGVETTAAGEIASDNAVNTTAAETAALTDSLPADLNFGGQTLNLFIRSDVSLIEEFYAEEENGDLFNDAIYKRNKSVEDKLNMKLNIILGTTWEKWVGTSQANIRASILAGDKAYDLIADWSLQASNLALDGLYMDVKRLPHLDLTQPWWNRSILDEAAIGNKLFFVAGDLTTTNLTSAFVFFYNKNLQREYSIPDLYQTVIDGKWTNDYLYQITKDIAKDLNGDGVMDDKDLYGIGLSPANVADSYLHSSRIKMISRNADGMPVLDAEQEKLSSLVDYLYTLLYESKGSYTLKVEDAMQKDMFKNDQYLFFPSVLFDAFSVYRDMKSDYGILPVPKYNEEQDGYYTKVWADVGTFMCVPSNCDKQELVGAFLEAAAFENHVNVMPAIYEKALKVKFVRDDMSAVMLDIIREGIYYNFAGIYNNHIGNPWWVLRDLMMAKNKNFASWYEKNAPKIEAALDKFMDKAQNME